MRAYSNDLRRAVVSASETQGYSQRQLARVCGVSLATGRTYLRRKRQTGSPDALPHAGGRPPTLSPQAQARGRQGVQEKNDIRLQLLCARPRGVFKRELSPSARCRLRQALGVRRKKEELARQ